MIDSATILPEVGVPDLHWLCDCVVLLLGIPDFLLAFTQDPTLCLGHHGWHTQWVPELSQGRFDDR